MSLLSQAEGNHSKLNKQGLVRGDDWQSCPKGVGSCAKHPILFRTLSFQVKRKIQMGLSKTGNL